MQRTNGEPADTIKNKLNGIGHGRIADLHTHH